MSKKTEKTELEIYDSYGDEYEDEYEADDEYEDIEVEDIEEYEDIEVDDIDEYEDEYEEQDDSECEMERLRKRKKRKKTTLIICTSLLAVIAAAYLGLAFFFQSHFYFSTEINGKDFSGKSIEEVETYLESKVDNYVLTLHEANGKEEQVNGKDIGIKYTKDKEKKELNKIMDDQNPFLWPVSLWKESEREVEVGVEYNQESLAEKMAALECMKAENQLASVDAHPKFNGTEFAVEPEVVGTQIHQENFTAKVQQYISEFRTDLNMAEEGCYIVPKFTSESKEVIAAKDSMNQYLKASITYKLEGADPIVVDKIKIAEWLSVDANMAPVFNTEAVGAFIDEFCGQYNTVGKTRSITTPTGKTAEVSGGTYGWKIDRDAECNSLINSIKGGEVTERTPEYAQSAATHGAQDWGNTYLEVDLSTQHMWYVKDGGVAFESAVVTGLPIPERITPEGVYDILEMKRNKTLRGEKLPDGTYSYETPVDYWMRVTWTGIGFHDAGWQPAFGGELYKTKGSHGCINMPPTAAAQLYNLIDYHTPVIIHY